MEIFPSEIDSVQEMGDIGGEPVNLVRLKGGLYLAVGKKNKKDTVLGSGSHPAIVRHNIQKSIAGFRASLMKSEDCHHEVVERTSFLPESLQKSGYELFEIDTLNKTLFSLTKHSKEIRSFSLESSSNSLELSHDNQKPIDGLSRAIAELSISKASAQNKKVKVK